MNPEQLANGGSEHAHQRALFAWAWMATNHGFAAANDMSAYKSKAYCEQAYGTHNAVASLDDMFAIPNGGKRDKITASKLKAEGVKADVCDIFLPVPCTSYCGLFIEMKKPGGTATPGQKSFIARALRRRYFSQVCVGWREAADLIKWYYSLGELYDQR